MSQVYWLTAMLVQPTFQKEAEQRIHEQFNYLATYLNIETQ